MVHRKLLPCKSEKYLITRKNIIVHKFTECILPAREPGAILGVTQSPHLFYLNPHKYPRDRHPYFPKDADEEIGIKKFSN